MKNRGLRIFLAVGAALAVLYFGTGGSNPQADRQVTNALLILAALAGWLVWSITGNNSNKPVS